MTTLLLVRHGETDWNAEGRLQGHTDRPLNDYGRRQAAALAEELAGREIDAIYASDLARARETAEIVAARIGLPVALDVGLREKNWGSLGGPDAVRARTGSSYEGESDRGPPRAHARAPSTASPSATPDDAGARRHARRLAPARAGGRARDGAARRRELLACGSAAYEDGALTPID